MPSIELAQAVAVTAELTGTELSKAAISVMLDDLSRYPEKQVLSALTRCRREVKGRMSIADVISRLDDGRPGVEEAWAMVPKDESTTVVWTEEMAQAMSGVRGLLAEGDTVAARMAFKESYLRLCQAARDIQKPVSWSASLGWDKSGRDAPMREAVSKGRLTENQVKIYLPEFVAEQEPPLLANPQAVRQAVRSLSDEMTMRFANAI